MEQKIGRGGNCLLSEEARLWKTDCLVAVRALCIRGEIYIQISSYKNKKLNLWQLSRGAAVNRNLWGVFQSHHTVPWVTPWDHKVSWCFEKSPDHKKFSTAFFTFSFHNRPLDPGCVRLKCALLVRSLPCICLALGCHPASQQQLVHLQTNVLFWTYFTNALLVWTFPSRTCLAIVSHRQYQATINTPLEAVAFKTTEDTALVCIQHFWIGVSLLILLQGLHQFLSARSFLVCDSGEQMRCVELGGKGVGAPVKGLWQLPLRSAALGE